MLDHQAAQEGVHVEDPRVRLAGVDVGAAEDDQIKIRRVGKIAGAVGGLVEGELGPRARLADGALVGRADRRKKPRAVRVEQDGYARWMW